MSSIIRILGCLAILSMIVITGCRNPLVTSGHIYLEQQNNPDKAQEVLAQAIQQTPNDPEAHFLMGKVYWMKKEYPEMVASFNRSLALSKSYQGDINEILGDLWKGNYNLAVSWFNKPKQLEDPHILDSLGLKPNSKEITELRIKYFQNSILFLDTAAIVEPTRWETYFLMGLSNENLGQPEKAADNYLKAVNIQIGIKTIGPGVKVIDIAKASKVKDLNPAFNLASVLFGLRRYDECIDYAQWVSDATEDSSVRLDAVKICASALGHLNRPADALKMYDRIIESAPNDANPYYDRALLSLDLGDTTKAITDFEKAVALNPKDFDAMEQLGLIYLESSGFLDYAKALAIFQKANTIKPHTYIFVRGIGKALVRLDRSEEATPYLEEATALFKEMKKK